MNLNMTAEEFELCWTLIYMSREHVDQKDLSKYESILAKLKRIGEKNKK